MEDFAPPRVEEEIAPKPVNMCILSEEENHLQNHGDEDAQRAASDAVVASSLAELTLAQESPESLRAVEISLVHSNLKETNPFEGFSTNEAHLPKNLHSPIAPIRPPNDKHDQTTGLPKLVLTKRNFVPSPYTQTHTSTISLLPPAHTSTKAHTHTHTHTSATACSCPACAGIYPNQLVTGPFSKTQSPALSSLWLQRPAPSQEPHRLPRSATTRARYALQNTTML